MSLQVGDLLMEHLARQQSVVSIPNKCSLKQTSLSQGSAAFTKPLADPYCRLTSC